MGKTMKYKVGDKVKTVSNIWWRGKHYTNKVGTVIYVDSSRSFCYIIDMGAIVIPVDEYEIEKVFTKGQQLLFSFME